MSHRNRVLGNFQLLASIMTGVQSAALHLLAVQPSTHIQPELDLDWKGNFPWMEFSIVTHPDIIHTQRLTPKNLTQLTMLLNFLFLKTKDLSEKITALVTSSP